MKLNNIRTGELLSKIMRNAMVTPNGRQHNENRAFTQKSMKGLNPLKRFFR